MPIRSLRPDEAEQLTLPEAKRWLSENLDQGAECPCCLQVAKVYQRKITASSAYALILIYRYFQKRDSAEWLHVPSYLNEQGLPPRVAAAIRGDWAKLVHWDLLEQRDDERPDSSRRVGEYRITDLGRQFVQGNVKVRKYVYLYNGGQIRRKGAQETVDIHQALGERFSYAELMRRAK